MATLGNKLRTKEMEWMSNMTEQSHLGKALLAKPAKLAGFMDKLFSASNYYADNPISSALIGTSYGEQTIGQTAWEWELKGANTRPLVVTERLETDPTPGKWKKTFRLKLDENWYLPGDVLSPGTSNKKYQVRVQNQVQKHGDGYVYTVRVNSDDNQMFIPQQYLNPGQQWGKLFSQYEEAAEQSGSTVFSMPIAFQNKMSKYRKEYRITDYASTEVLAMKVPDSKGGMQDSWMRYADIEYWIQWYREIERGHWYSRSAETVMGANGRPVRMGAGIQEQLEDSHTHTYSHLSAKLIEDYLQDIFYSRVKPGKGRQIKGYTGEYGMLQFHRAIQDWSTKNGFIKNIEMFTNKTSSPYTDRGFETGYQYVKYHMANGSSLELIHNPLYDDREINFELDPVTGYPVESQRITFLDFSGSNSKNSNIQIMNKKDGFAFTYVEGMYGPYGPKNGGSSAHAGAYYEMHVEKSVGIHIEDVTKCGELIFSRN